MMTQYKGFNIIDSDIFRFAIDEILTNCEEPLQIIIDNCRKYELEMIMTIEFSGDCIFINVAKRVCVTYEYVTKFLLSDAVILTIETLTDYYAVLTNIIDAADVGVYIEFNLNDGELCKMNKIIPKIYSRHTIRCVLALDVVCVDDIVKMLIEHGVYNIPFQKIAVK